MDHDFYKSYFKAERNHWWFRARRNIILYFLRKYALGGRSKRILDVGCGSGYLVGRLQKEGYQVFGCDISLDAVEFGRDQGIANLSVVKDRLDFPADHFNMILNLDVLEHLEDDICLIEDIKRILCSNGIAIVTVPAFQFLWGAQDEISCHYRRYRLSQLLDKFKSADFEIIKKSYFNTFLFSPIALTRLISRIFNLKSRQSDFDINSKFSNWIFYHIFNLEGKFLRYFNFPFGVSILLILKKK